MISIVISSKSSGNFKEKYLKFSSKNFILSKEIWLLLKAPTMFLPSTFNNTRAGAIFWLRFWQLGVPLAKGRDWISMLQNFYRLILILLGFYWAFQIKKFADFSSKWERYELRRRQPVYINTLYWENRICVLIVRTLVKEELQKDSWIICIAYGLFLHLQQ